MSKMGHFITGCPLIGVSLEDRVLLYRCPLIGVSLEDGFYCIGVLSSECPLKTGFAGYVFGYSHISLIKLTYRNTVEVVMRGHLYTVKHVMRGHLSIQ